METLSLEASGSSLAEAGVSAEGLSAGRLRGVPVQIEQDGLGETSEEGGAGEEILLGWTCFQFFKSTPHTDSKF